MAAHTMRKITFEEAQRIAGEKGLVPVEVQGTNRHGAGGILRFAKARTGMNPHLQVITWTGFEDVLRDRGLAVYESKGWMKVMREGGT